MSQKITEENRGESIKEHRICIDELTLHYMLYEIWLAAEERYSYSLSIACTCNQETDTVCAHDITSLRDTAVQIYDKIQNCQVTPCTLFDILEDLL